MARAVRTGLADRFTALIPPAGNILDLGCGMGEPIAAHLIRAGFHLTGVDSARTLLGLCRRASWTKIGAWPTCAAWISAAASPESLAWDSFFIEPR